MDKRKARISGTKEWSVQSVNCLTGCSHDCRYCYARANALRFGRITSADQWRTPQVRQREIDKRRTRAPGRVMFPSTHDILPDFLEPCLAVLRNLLAAGNEVLLVSKPHLACIEAICQQCQAWRSQVVFRFTIGARRDDLLAYWEPGAPGYGERLASLQYAYGAGYQTSVSCEPLLDADDAVGLFDELEPWVTDTIWLGKMNQIASRVIAGTSRKAIQRIEAGQTPERIRGIYQALQDRPKVRWKESYKAVLGLELAREAGLDF